ncbi:MAG TPA: DUF503 domain-containing protein [Thermoleophilaceae bacterium]|jgi:uncharacterized protein YlxP (DUF503 family)
MSFICLLEIHLHFPEAGSLKSKRKELQSLKAHLRQRFGASVAETDHQDLWQRSTLSAALAGRDVHSVEEAADNLTRYVESQFPDGVRVERGIISADEILRY